MKKSTQFLCKVAAVCITACGSYAIINSAYETARQNAVDRYLEASEKLTSIEKSIPANDLEMEEEDGVITIRNTSTEYRNVVKFEDGGYIIHTMRIR